MNYAARLLSLALFVSLASSSGPALAQSPQRIATGEPSAYRFYVAPGAGNFLMVDNTTIGREWEPSVGVMLDYAHRPFALDEYQYLTFTSATPGGPELDVVGGMMVAQLTGAVGIADIVQIGLNLPIIAYTWGDGHQWTETSSTGGTRPNGFSTGNGAAIGDPRIHGKVRLFDQDLGGGAYLGVAVVGWLTLPVARAMLPHRYAGETNVAGGGHVVVGFHWAGLRLAINLGAGIREDQQLILSRRTSEMTWGAALAYDFDEMLGAMVEIVGQTTFGTQFDDEAPTELRLAGYLRAGDLTFTLGAGIGIAYAVGVPVVRILGGATWEPRPRDDADGDHLTDDVDGCPSEAEDLDQNEDEDGCPDLDDDRDGILDAEDACRSEAEDRDGHADEDGCPDLDDDEDGVPDGYDSCPNEPEDRDGDRDQDGCPDDDRDHDHVADANDPCPDAAEDTDGLADEDGCPEEDFDADGVADVDDECPEEREDRDGFEDSNGCPEEGGGGPRRIRGR